MKTPSPMMFPKRCFSLFSSRTTAAAVLLAAVLWLPNLTTPPAAGSTFSEPHTVFYGKVLGTGSVQPFLISEGQLRWTILRADGETITLETSLYAYHDGSFSYRLDVPHSAFALGLDSGAGDIPMPPMPQTHLHAAVTVDGEHAELLGPASAAFTTEQLLRTATHRLDLGVARQATDTDGDGMPDWWEDLYGLDKQNPSDASTDLSGDGITALEAYLRGLDPTRDHRAPVVLTEESIVYPSGTTAVLLDTFAIDNEAGQLHYTLTRLPDAGTLTLRNANPDPDDPDAVLMLGDPFTQADLLKGRLVYDHDGSDADPGFFGVEVRNENPEHPAFDTVVRLLAFEPGEYVPGTMTPLEAQRFHNHLHAGLGFVIMDASSLPPDTELANPSAGLDTAALTSYLETYGDDRPYVLSGGAGEAVTLTGGHRNDILEAGTDGGILTGGAGSDEFTFRNVASGRAIITDFVPSDGDMINLSCLPAAPGDFVHDYLRLCAIDEGYELQVDRNGNGSMYTNLSIALPGLPDSKADLYHLIANHHLRVGALRLEPRIHVVAGRPRASQNGPVEGWFTLRREGCLLDELSVNITMSGSAQNGSDYALIASRIIMPPDIPEVNVILMPYQTGYAGPAKIAQLSLAQGDGYRVGAQQSADVTIESLMPIVEVETRDELVVQTSGTPGKFVIRRSDVTDTHVTIWLETGGSARPGTDYAALPDFIEMAPGQASVVLNVSPLADADLGDRARTVDLTILPDRDYMVITGSDSGRITLIARLDSLNEWRDREFSEFTGDMNEFADADSGSRGLTHFQRYAFGLGSHDPDMSGLPRPFLHEGRLIVTFRRPLGLTDVIYRVTAATDLDDTEGSAVTMTEIPAPHDASDPEQVYYRIGDEAATSPKAFAIIKAEWKP